MTKVRNDFPIAPIESGIGIKDAKEALKGFRSDIPNKSDENNSKKTSDSQVNSMLNKIDPSRGREVEPKVTQSRIISETKIGSDQQKHESQTKYVESKESAKGLNNLATNGNVTKTPEKQSAGQNTNMQTALQQAPQAQQRAPQANPQQPNMPIAELPKQNVAANTINLGVKIGQNDSQKPAVKGPKDTKTTTDEQRAKQLASIQAGTNAATVAGTKVATKESTQQNSKTADSSIEKQKEDSNTEEGNKTEKSPFSQAATSARHLKEMSAGGTNVGTNAGGAGNTPSEFEIAANKIGDDRDPLEDIEAKGGKFGSLSFNLTHVDLPPERARLAATEHNEKVIKPQKQDSLTLDQIVAYNSPQDLVGRIVADTKDLMAEARKLFNTSRTGPYGLMSA